MSLSPAHLQLIDIVVEALVRAALSAVVPDVEAGVTSLDCHDGEAACELRAEADD